MLTPEKDSLVHVRWMESMQTVFLCRACLHVSPLSFTALHYYMQTEMNGLRPVAITVLTKYLPAAVGEGSLQRDDRLPLLYRWKKGSCSFVFCFYRVAAVVLIYEEGETPVPGFTVESLIIVLSAGCQM